LTRTGRSNCRESREVESAYSTLDEAFASGAFRISEVSEAGSVPELLVLNDTGRDVLILDGEELIGAKQNRIVNLTILVPARSRLGVPVSCVEAGRWQHQSRNFSAARRTYYSSGRAMKARHVTEAYRTTSRPLSNQTAIWEDIALKSERLQACSPTSAMDVMYERAAAALEQFEAHFVSQPLQAGAVFVLDGVPVGLDVFDSPETWRKLAPKLTASYGLDALDRRVARRPRHGAVSPELDVTGLLSRVAGLRQERYPAVGLGEDVRLTGEDLSGGALLVGEHVVHLAVFFRDAVAEQ
jgi:hypothetical protein